MAKDILQDEKIIYKDKNLDKVEFERTTDYDVISQISIEYEILNFIHVLGICKRIDLHHTTKDCSTNLHLWKIHWR
jgi:hypothetical protein